MTNLLYKSFAAAGGDRALWNVGADRLRILCYHGVCDDRLAGAAWLPSYFVTKSAFDEQLRYLRDRAHLLSLAEGVRRLREGTLPERSVCLTFDDGYANNLYAAGPLLEKYKAPATVFLSTAYIESGEYYPFLQLKLVRMSRAAAAVPEYKNNPVDTVIEGLRPYWPEVSRGLSQEQRETLRPLTIDEVREAAAGGQIEFGAHSHTHCILRNEDRERRDREIRVSVELVAKWTGREARLFSYPNGEPGDFGEGDKDALRAAGVDVAVTGIGGSNARPTDPLELRRYPLTIHHDMARFRAEVSGFRHMMTSMWGQRGA